MRVKKRNVVYIDNRQNTDIGKIRKSIKVRLVSAQKSLVPSYLNIKTLNQINIVDASSEIKELGKHVSFLFSDNLNNDDSLYVMISKDNENIFYLAKRAFWKI